MRTVPKGLCPFSRVAFCAWLVGLLLLSGCSFYNLEQDPFYSPALSEISPNYSIAVMPVRSQKKIRPQTAHLLRETIYEALSTLDYQDVELEKVDETLSAVSMERRVAPRQLPASVFQDGRLADSLLYAEILDISKIWLLFYAHNSVQVRLNWLDARSGGLLYQNEMNLHNRCISIPLSINSLFQSTIYVALQLREKEVRESLEQFGVRLQQSFPQPPTSHTGVGIDSIQIVFPDHEKEKDVAVVLEPGQHIEVRVWGTQGQRCAFDLRSDIQNIPMEEKEPGYYVGRYQVKPGDTTAAGIVRVTLTTTWGEEVRKSLLDGHFTIQAGPPVQPLAPAKAEGARSRPGIEAGWWHVRSQRHGAFSIGWEELGAKPLPALQAGDRCWMELQATRRELFVYAFIYDTALGFQSLPIRSGVAAGSFLIPGPEKEAWTLKPPEGPEPYRQSMVVLVSSRALAPLEKKLQRLEEDLSQEEKTEAINDLVNYCRSQEDKASWRHWDWEIHAQP